MDANVHLLPDHLLVVGLSYTSRKQLLSKKCGRAACSSKSETALNEHLSNKAPQFSVQILFLVWGETPALCCVLSKACLLPPSQGNHRHLQSW